MKTIEILENRTLLAGGSSEENSEDFNLFTCKDSLCTMLPFQEEVIASESHSQMGYTLYTPSFAEKQSYDKENKSTFKTSTASSPRALDLGSSVLHIVENIIKDAPLKSLDMFFAEVGFCTGDRGNHPADRAHNFGGYYPTGDWIAVNAIESAYKYSKKDYNGTVSSWTDINFDMVAKYLSYKGSANNDRGGFQAQGYYQVEKSLTNIPMYLNIVASKIIQSREEVSEYIDEINEYRKGISNSTDAELAIRGLKLSSKLSFSVGESVFLIATYANGIKVFENSLGWHLRGQFFLTAAASEAFAFGKSLVENWDKLEHQNKTFSDYALDHTLISNSALENTDLALHMISKWGGLGFSALVTMVNSKIYRDKPYSLWPNIHSAIAGWALVGLGESALVNGVLPFSTLLYQAYGNSNASVTCNANV